MNRTETYMNKRGSMLLSRPQLSELTLQLQQHDQTDVNKRKSLIPNGRMTFAHDSRFNTNDISMMGVKITNKHQSLRFSFGEVLDQFHQSLEAHISEGEGVGIRSPTVTNIHTSCTVSQSINNDTTSDSTFMFEDASSDVDCTSSSCDDRLALGISQSHSTISMLFSIPEDSTTNSNNAICDNIPEGTDEDLVDIDDEDEDHVSRYWNLSEQVLACCSSENDDYELLDTLICDLKQACTDPSRFKLDGVRNPKLSNCTCMHLAAQKNKVHSMEVLVKHNATIDTLDTIHATPLFYACAHNASDAATFLLHHGANVNQRDIYNNFPALVALKANNYAVVEMLMLYNANLHLKSSRGSCLHLLAELGNYTAVKFLLEKCAASPYRLNDDEENLLFSSLAHTKLVQYLIKRCDVKKLVTRSNIRKRTVFHECCYNGYMDSMMMVLSACLASPDFSDASIGDLLNQKDAMGKTPLMHAVQGKKHKMIRFLCTCKSVQVDAQDSDGNTALHMAIKQKDMDAITVLVLVGEASKKVKNKSKITCIRLAKQLGVEIPKTEEEEEELDFLQLMKEDNLLQDLDGNAGSPIPETPRTSARMRSISDQKEYNTPLAHKNKQELRKNRSVQPMVTTDEPDPQEELSFLQLMKMENEMYSQEEAASGPLDGSSPKARLRLSIRHFTKFWKPSTLQASSNNNSNNNNNVSPGSNGSSRPFIISGSV